METPFIPLLLPGLLIGIATWVGLRYFSKKTNYNQLLNETEAHQEAIQETTSEVVQTLQPIPTQSLLPSARKIDRIIKDLKKSAKWSFAILITVSISLSTAFLFNEKHKKYNFIPKEYAYGDRIKLTLEEELLVPPPPLPPEAFTDALIQQPNLNTANRDWALLNPAFVQQVLHVIEKLKTRGYPMTLLEGYRSPERQDALAGQAVLVTKAKGGQSRHQYGLAVDLAPVKDGKIVISEKDPWAMAAYVALGEEAQAAGLTWGGVWRFRDYGHIERSGALPKRQNR